LVAVDLDHTLADRAVLDRAGAVTGSCDDDGVAGYLDTLLR
jgi:hypothetical protein